MRRIESEFVLRAAHPTEYRILATPVPAYAARERVVVAFDGEEIVPETVEERHGQRELRVSTPAGELSFSLQAEIEGSAPIPWMDDPQRYAATSRYVDVDAVRAFASERFGGAEPRVAVEAIVRWIARSFEYRPELSDLDDTSTDSLQKSGGMCRDYAHVTIALVRALGIPARYVSVYAPQLQPQDFHAVAEVFIDEQWWLVDATFLAPRASMIRISTGLDAEETAWATNTGSGVTLRSMRVDATNDETLEIESSDEWVQLR
ncbi:transglutaminase family protein [uncultured Agrococcus sp.]|uniref:transglutaminase-like domain-containing protein n=1 Tax=uncultured Agrococcus sp. TaxID=382258 RepID=UPI0025D66984|nr:transglutaminase domain-containing protein [uncultured Agrococcus sp.]